MNFQNILIQFTNQMINIHMILNINFFYINYQQREHCAVMYKTLYIPEMLSKTPECIAEKLVTHSFSVFFPNYMKNYFIWKAWLKIAIFDEMRKASITKNLLDK